MKSLVPSFHIFGDIVRSNPFIYLDDWFKGFGFPRPFFSDQESVLPIKIDLNENGKNYTIRAENSRG